MTTPMTLLDYLNAKGEIRNGIIAKTIGNLIQFEIIGYFPIQSDTYFSELIGIGVSQVCVKDSSSLKVPFLHYPIADKLSIDIINTFEIKNEHPIFLDNKNFRNVIIKKWEDYTEKGHALRSKYPDYFEQETPFRYKIQESDIIFKRNNNIIGIATDFLCICSYISPITGKAEYTVKFPSELIPTIPPIE